MKQKIILTMSSLLVANSLLTAAPSEQDRKAILSMAGEFEVKFFFKETLSLKKGYEIKEGSYSEKAHEKVIVIRDEGNEIELQHILMVDDHVVKHWSHIWKYENTALLEFQGDRTWKERTLSKEEAKGTWSQLVTQTTDSPRYESYGKWEHDGDSSTWTSSLTNRPLPRREYKKRKDYDILECVNRHTVTPTGWAHEQDSAKRVKRDGKSELLCREVGMNTYTRVEGVDFAVVDKFWKEHGPFWMVVKQAWNEGLTGKKETKVLNYTNKEGNLRSVLKEQEEENNKDLDKLRKVIAPYIVNSNKNL